MLIIGAVALIAFGPDQLPKVARRAGQVMRDVQNSSQSFIREMERAADEPVHHEWTPPPANPMPPAAASSTHEHDAPAATHETSPSPAEPAG